MAFLWSVLYVIAIGIASHFIGEAIPRDRFDAKSALFRTRAWERGGRIYEKLKIQKWKDRMPDMSRIMKDMVPKRVGACPKAADVWVLVGETCRAEAVHWGLCVASLAICLFWLDMLWAGLALSLAVILGNIPFILIQRYNRPMLIDLAKRLEVREERKRKNARIDPIG